MTIDILCKVVDNFGDIGVVYRLARALSELDPGLSLRVVVDDLAAFRALCPQVRPGEAVQAVNGWTVARWDADASAVAAPFLERRPRSVIECFACGRPGWYEDILFDEGDEADRLIVDLEYLTAEGWAEEFHRLPSATRSARVKKVMFMPGFAAPTGGLIQDRLTRGFRAAYSGAERTALRRALLERLSEAGAATTPAAGGAAAVGPSGDGAEAYWVTAFSYERDYRPIVRSLAAVGRARPLLVFSAAGRSAAPLAEAWTAEGRPFPLVRLPFLRQETWDEVVMASDFAVARGEDSLSRAALSGRPFLWHAYPLEDGAQLAKVRALLDRMRPHFEPADFALVESLWLAFNGAFSGDRASEGEAAGIGDLIGRRGNRADAAFRSWSDSLWENGDLARDLLTFIRDFG